MPRRRANVPRTILCVRSGLGNLYALANAEYRASRFVLRCDTKRAAARIGAEPRPRKRKEPRAFFARHAREYNKSSMPPG